MSSLWTLWWFGSSSPQCSMVPYAYLVSGDFTIPGNYRKATLCIKGILAALERAKQLPSKAISSLELADSTALLEAGMEGVFIGCAAAGTCKKMPSNHLSIERGSGVTRWMQRGSDGGWTEIPRIMQRGRMEGRTEMTAEMVRDRTDAVGVGRGRIKRARILQ